MTSPADSLNSDPELQKLLNAACPATALTGIKNHISHEFEKHPNRLMAVVPAVLVPIASGRLALAVPAALFAGAIIGGIDVVGGVVAALKTPQPDPFGRDVRCVENFLETETHVPSRTPITESPSANKTR